MTPEYKGAIFAVRIPADIQFRFGSMAQEHTAEAAGLALGLNWMRRDRESPLQRMWPEADQLSKKHSPV